MPDGDYIDVVPDAGRPSTPTIADAPSMANWELLTLRDTGRTALRWATEDGQLGAIYWKPAQLEKLRLHLNRLRDSRPEVFGE